MAKGEVTRRLAAIVAADVAGFSRLISADEEGTLAALRSYRTELIEPKVTEYRGRIANTAGDSFLIEFPSVVEALRCSVDVQRGMAKRNIDFPEDRQIRYRIGINVGDVVEQGTDLLGDGVNVAARLEGIADPGGIVLSNVAMEQVGGRVDVGFKDLGEQSLKNIPKPVRAHRVQLEKNIAPPPVAGSRRRSWSLVAVATAIAALVVAGALWWWQPWIERDTPTNTENLTYALPDKPSVAVLPFQNMSNDPDQIYFADGIAEDIITDLSKISGLFVIARNSSFQYRGDSVNVKTVGRELGVKYVLEGSVRRSGDQVRINAQLIDASTGSHLWAERYDGKLDDIFATQDRVTTRIVDALSVKLAPDETVRLKRHGTDNAHAYDAYLKGWAHFQKETPEDYTRAKAYLGVALKLDPNYQRAHAALASLYSEGERRNWGAALGASEPFELNILAIKHLAAVTDPYPAALRVRAYQTRIDDEDFDTAIAISREAVTLAPNDADAYIALAQNLTLADQADDAFPLIKKAMRLNPRYPVSYQSELARAYFFNDELERAVSEGREVIDKNPNIVEIYAIVISALGHLGKSDAAAAVIDALQNQRTKLNREPYFPKEVRREIYANPKQEAKLYDGLIMAGLQKLIDWQSVDTATRLSNEQARALLVGHKIVGFKNLGGAYSAMVAWSRRFRIDGEVREYDQYHDRETVGRFRFEEDKLCANWEGGDADCWEIRKYPTPTPGYQNDYIGIDKDGIVWTFSVIR